MIKIEVRKVRSHAGTKGLLVTKTVCLPEDKLPKEYLQLNPGEVRAVSVPLGMLITKNIAGRLHSLVLQPGHAYDAAQFLNTWEDIQQAGNRLTAIRKKLREEWDGTVMFKY